MGMGVEALGKLLSSTCFICKWIYASFYDIFIVLRKNIRIRVRRYMAFLMEILTPIFVVSLLVRANNHKSLLRLQTLDYFTDGLAAASAENSTLEGFYDLGSHYDEVHILQRQICRQPSDFGYCIIGCVADDLTFNTVCDSDYLKKQVNSTAGRTRIVRFDTEQEIEDCLQEGMECQKLDDIIEENRGADQETRQNAILGFRGALVFETSVGDSKVRYKIRLMEKFYNSLAHVQRTTRVFPTLYDRREYGLSYLESGFLALQLITDRVIIEYIKTLPSTDKIKASEVRFDTTSGDDIKCTCEVSMHEIPHRQSDQFYDPDEADEQEDYEEASDLDETEFLQQDSRDLKRLNQVNKQSLIVSSILVLSFTFLLPSEQRRIGSEKENGLTILLLVTGMTHRMQWVGNLIAIAFSYVFTITVVALLLTIRFNKTEGAVFEYASFSVLWLLFFLYVMALASACYFTLVFFNKTVVAIAFSVAFWLASFIAPVYHVDYYYDIVPLWATLLMCLHPSIACQMAIRLLIRFERHKIKTNIFTMSRYIPTDPLRIIYIVVVLIFDITVYMVLVIYLDRVLKSKFGVKKPWYYLFSSSEYSRSNVNQVTPLKMVHRKSIHANQPGTMEAAEDENAEPSVITTNLTKTYGNVVAVEKLNLELFHGEIFALLGPNGSGKSTTLNMFSGFTSVSSGTANICGYDIRTHTVQIQAFTGMCPQYSWLYDDLTPYEHLLIFGRLRGLKGSEADEQSMELLEKLRINEMAHWTIRTLSTGDKRKVSLAIALIGNPKVVLLDEPTGGLDYYSRRAVWDLLLKTRSNHTILFTTHYMEEAELLGDRIGILVGGKLQVCGSHAFLRRHFGLGYSLKVKMNLHKKTDPVEILTVIHGSMPQATLSKLPVSPNPIRNFTFNLPEYDYSAASMSSLFTDLARVKETLGIVGFSVSYATVEEVFLSLMRQLNTSGEEVEPIRLENEDYHEESHDENMRKLFDRKTRCANALIQFWVLFSKRCLFNWRYKWVMMFQFTVPSIIFFVGLFRLSSHVDLHGREGPPFELTLDRHPGVVTLYHATVDTFLKPEHVKKAIGSTATYTISSDLSGDYIRVNYDELRSRHFVGISAETGSKGQLYVHYSPYIMHSAPIALSLYSNALVRYLDNDREIVTTNHPIQNPYFEGPSFEEDPYAADIYAMMVIIAASITCAFDVLYPLEERLNGTKHLQMMTGVNCFLYWLSIFLWDILPKVVPVAISACMKYLLPTLRYFAQVDRKEGTGKALYLVCLSYVFSGTMVPYLMSQFAHSRSGAFALMMTNLILFSILLPFIILGIGPDNANVDPNLSSFLQLMPTYAATAALRKYALTLLENARCNHFTKMGELEYCSAHFPSTLNDSRRVGCCPNCVEIHGSLKCYDRYELLRFPWVTHYHSNVHFEMTHSEEQEEQENGHTHEHNYSDEGFEHTQRIFFEVLAMVVVGLALSVMVIVKDSNTWRYISSCIHGERARAFQTNIEDEDVLDEMDLVERMVDRETTHEEAMVVHNMCKSYGIYPAVHNLSFNLHPGETFGIIGVNGAGKSTLFGLLTGDKTKTYGNIYAVDCSLNSKRGMLMRKMGYVPQSGQAYFDYYTCAETLIHYGRLRGLSKADAKSASDVLLKKMQLVEYADQRMESLSGGIRRRLGTSVAMMAQPPIILLDEPTSAADPTSRRIYWELIKEVKLAGHTVVLSSHRIHEVEDLCHRMVIMVDGKFQCIGSPNHLKEKFGSGFKLIVKLIPGPAESQGYVSSLSDAIVKTFSPCTLRDRRRNVIQYVIHDASVSWDYLFQMMEHIKLRYNDLVEDYAFSDTTLEEVFLSFVVLQNCGRILDTSQGCCACCNFI